MNEQFELITKRIDAMSPRERVFLFLSLLVGILALADTFWLTPAMKAQKQLVQQFSAQSLELDRLRAELAVNTHPKNSNQEMREQIAALQERIESVNHDIAALVPQSPDGPALEQVLVAFLRRQEGLTLISTSTLNDEVVASTPAGAASAPANAAGSVQRRGLELRVAGSYADLMRYVKTLEVSLPALRWGPMQLKANQKTSELTLRVYVVGVRP